MMRSVILAILPWPSLWAQTEPKSEWFRQFPTFNLAAAVSQESSVFHVVEEDALRELMSRPQAATQLFESARTAVARGPRGSRDEAFRIGLYSLRGLTVLPQLPEEMKAEITAWIVDGWQEWKASSAADGSQKFLMANDARLVAGPGFLGRHISEAGEAVFIEMLEDVRFTSVAGDGHYAAWLWPSAQRNQAMEKRASDPGLARIMAEQKLMVSHFNVPPSGTPATEAGVKPGVEARRLFPGIEAKGSNHQHKGSRAVADPSEDSTDLSPATQVAVLVGTLGGLSALALGIWLRCRRHPRKQI